MLSRAVIQIICQSIAINNAIYMLKIETQFVLNLWRNLNSYKIQQVLLLRKQYKLIAVKFHLRKNIFWPVIGISNVSSNVLLMHHKKNAR